MPEGRNLFAEDKPTKGRNLFSGGITPEMVDYANQQQAQQRRESLGRLEQSGRDYIDFRRRQQANPFSKTGQEGAFVPIPTDPTKTGIELAGSAQGASFGWADELLGLANKEAGNDLRQDTRIARQEDPGTFSQGEIVGAGVNALATAPIVAPRTLQISRFMPGGNISKNAAGSALTGLAYDTAYQMGAAEGDLGQRVGQINPVQSAVAAGVGGLAGGIMTALTNPMSRQALELNRVLEGVVDRGAVSPDGLRQLERLLRDSNFTIDREAINGINSAIDSVREGGSEALSLPVRLKDILVKSAQGRGGALPENIERTQRGTSGAGGEGAQTIARAVDEDLPAARDYVQGGLKEDLGSQPRLAEQQDIEQRLADIGREGYQPLFARGVQSEEGAQALRDVLEGPGMGAGRGSNTIRQPLQTIADGEGIDLEKFIADRPLEAAHWMQSKARELADGEDPVYQEAFTKLRDRLLTAIEKASPGYNNIRRQYGDEYGNKQALTFADRFLTDAPHDYRVDKMAQDFKALSPAQQEVALLSVRDMLQSSMGRGRRINGPRLTQVEQEQVQTALPKVFGDAGERVLKRIEDVQDFVGSRRRIDTRRRGSQTAPLTEDITYAKNLAAPPIRRAVGNWLRDASTDAGLSVSFGQAVPFRTITSTGQKVGEWIAGDPTRKMNALAQLLEAPVAPARTGGQTMNALSPSGGSAQTPTAAATNALGPQDVGRGMVKGPDESPLAFADRQIRDGESFELIDQYFGGRFEQALAKAEGGDRLAKDYLLQGMRALARKRDGLGNREIDAILQRFNAATDDAERLALAQEMRAAVSQQGVGDIKQMGFFGFGRKAKTASPGQQRAAPPRSAERRFATEGYSGNKAEAAQAYLNEMSMAGSQSPEAFDAVLARLASDRDITKKELKLIAKNYTGYAQNGSRDEIIQDIAHSFDRKWKLANRTGERPDYVKWQGAAIGGGTLTAAATVGMNKKEKPPR